MGKIEIGAPGWKDAHLELYIRTDGAEGHLLDCTPTGGYPDGTCLILKTTGRRTGQPQLSPLIYGPDGQNFIIVASKGGAPNHPAWFLNLEAHPEVEFQVIDKKYKGVARITKGAERERLFAMMVAAQPFYADYQAKTDREIPVIALQPIQPIERL